MSDIKSCLFCKHCNYKNEQDDWSELTPGNDFEIDCNKYHWYLDKLETTQEEFGEMITMANTCKDYERC